MIFTINMIRQIFLLVAMLIMCSVSGRGVDNLREAAETEPTMDDNTKHDRRQEETVCGRRQILTSTRDEGQGDSNDLDQSDHLDKILGGSDVTYGQVPWHVNIYRGGRRKCGGAIISEYWILTAASCVVQAPRNQLKMVVGDHQLSVNESWQETYGVRRIVVHADFIISSMDYDIALIKVEPANGHGILFNNYVQPICLPAAGESPADNTSLTVSGWGDPSTVPNTQSSDTLQTAVLPVISHSQCGEYLQAEDITERMLCVWRTDGADVDVCITDYGGPATYQSGDTNILAGIIIAGSMCMPEIYPASLTDVAVLRTWIDDSINQYSSRSQRVMPSRAD